MILSGTFESSSSSAVYKTQYDTETGKGTCNCPGWTKRAVRECKHTKDLAKRGTHETLIVKLNEPIVKRSVEIKPMLASAMKEGQSLEDFMDEGWIMEEKYDGHRLLIYVDEGKVTAWTRPGHERPAAVRPLPALLTQELSQLASGVYDGELLLPGGTSSDVVRLDKQDELVLVLFDALIVMGENIMAQPLSKRSAVLALAYQGITKPKRVRVAQQMPVSMDTVRFIWRRGGEGVVIKRKASAYKSGWRTPDWIKVKQIDAAEFTVTGFEEGKNGPCSIFKLRHDDGRETTCKVLTNELLALVHANPEAYIGRRLTISHMGFTKSGLWRHPVYDHFND